MAIGHWRLFFYISRNIFRVKIDSHISELLYDHDCVIVPSFGGFLGSYTHAKIHATQHTLSPPSKKIAFNIFLKQNDGLLANHISNQEKLSYTDALNQIERHVNQWQKELGEGNKLIIERIGTFYFDAEKNLQFDAVKNINYLRDAFGFDTVQYLPVKREDFQQKVESQVKELIAIRPSERQDKKPLKLSRKIKQRIISALVISVPLLWLSYVLYVITPHHDLSSLNPFSSTDNTEQLSQETKTIPSLVTPVAPSKVETVYVANANPINPSVTPPAIAEKEELKTVASPVQQVVVSTGNQKYFVIGGAFQVRENAESFVKTLQTEGFSEARILDTAKNLKMVCFKGFSTREEAIKEADSLKSHGKDGWIYKW